jgi:NitT/TauT family transport system permease protein
MNKYKVWLYPSLLLIVLLIAWEMSSKLLKIPSYILPAPSKLFIYFGDYLKTGALLPNIWTTIQEILIGTLGGIILGLLLGYLMAKLSIIERLLMPVILIIQIAPKISLAPLFILWFGLGLSSKITLVILVVSFPVMVNEHTALKQIDTRYREFLTILKASRWQHFTKLELPFALASVMSGIKISVTQAMTGAVIGEMMGAKSGLGYLLTYGNEMYDINIILCSVIVLSIIGLILYYSAEFIEKKLLYWM